MGWVLNLHQSVEKKKNKNSFNQQVQCFHNFHVIVGDKIYTVFALDLQKAFPPVTALKLILHFNTSDSSLSSFFSSLPFPPFLSFSLFQALYYMKFRPYLAGFYTVCGKRWILKMLRKHWLSGEIYLPEPEITSFLDFFLKHWHLSSRILPFPLSPLSRKHTRACLLRMQQNLADTRSWSFYSFCFYTQ